MFGILCSVYDLIVGIGGMLFEFEKYMFEKNFDVNIQLFGQEYNFEFYVICCFDFLIKDELINNLIYGDILGIKDVKNKINGFVFYDGYLDKKFYYMLVNLFFGVEWKLEEDFVCEEYEDQGFFGCFGVGLLCINDGLLFFLQYMIFKMYQLFKIFEGKNVGGDGFKIVIVFNGLFLFIGDVGLGEFNICCWIIECDMLDVIVVLFDQMFYNMGIYIYVWIVINKKFVYCQGQVQLIDGICYFKKMDKSLGNKCNEFLEEYIRELVCLYVEYDYDVESEVLVDGKLECWICSKIFENCEFGFLKIIVECLLCLNFQVSVEWIVKLDD